LQLAEIYLDYLLTSTIF